MLLNLKVEILKRGITQKAIVDYLGMTASYFVKKIKCQYELSRDEMYLIHDKFFPDVDMYYLFKSEK